MGSTVQGLAVKTTKLLWLHILGDKMKPILGFAAGVAIMCSAFWVAGYDFDERNATALLLYIYSLAAGVLGAFAAKEFL